MKLSAALKALIENSDDLSTLPQLVARAEEMENSEGDYLERIAKLQEINKTYLAQIPIPGETPEEATDEEEPTLDDAKNVLIELLGGN